MAKWYIWVGKYHQGVSSLINKSHGGIHRHDNPFHFSNIFHECCTLIIILLRGILISLLSKNRDKSVGMNIHTKLPHHIRLKSHFQQEIMTVKVFSRGICVSFFKDLNGLSRCKYCHLPKRIVSNKILERVIFFVSVFMKV
jgi:hypothetical protein